MENTKKGVEQKTLCDVLHAYGFMAEIINQKEYISKFIVDNETMFIKYVFGIILKDGQHLILKLFREEEDPDYECVKIENQSAFSEILRSNGVKTPKRYKNKGAFATKWRVDGEFCVATIEDWCGDEITEINIDLAQQIGCLMATIHMISINNNFKIGNDTLFCAAFENDVNVYSDFCDICNNENLKQDVVTQIKIIYNDKLQHIRKLWDKLPKSATQGDFSINNLSKGKNDIVVFDYNNAGDEVLISDLILEGLLVAYEMDLPIGTPETFCNDLFLSLLNGYLSVRKLTDMEKEVAWDIYTLYQSLWFSKIKFNDNSLEKLVSDGKFDEANALLYKMLSDITAQDDGRFQGE